MQATLENELPEVERSIAASGQQRVVLVVDDSPVDAALVSGLLSRRMQARVVCASNGVAALAMIEQHQPDLVLTDLQMPEMDGLELVEAIRDKHPGLPTVLMTAYGSEEVAIRALQRGAASYVRKQDAARRLVETASDVLALAAGYRPQRQLRQCWSQTTFEFVLDNNPALILPLVSHLQQYVGTMAVRHESDTLRLGVALCEAITNAIFHGNLELNSELRESGPESYLQMAQLRRGLEPYCRRKVTITAAESAESAVYVVQDDGPGFDPRSASYDADDPEQLHKPAGRGLFLIRTFMDEVYFNERGNEITMIFRRRGEDSIDGTQDVAAGA